MIYLAFFSIETFQNVYTKYVATNARLRQAFGSSATLLSPNFSAGSMTIPYPSFVNLFEQNLQKMAEIPEPQISVDTKTWRGRDVLTGADVARWLLQLQKIQDAADARILDTLYVGTFAVGNDRTAQSIRRGN